jgi:opacity protein-like surface antigen
MEKRWRTILIISVLTSVVLTGALQANEVAEKAAIMAASAWLSVVDEGNYAESWNQAARFFKDAVTKEQWLNSMKTFRVPLGKMMIRKLKSKQYAKTLPGAPDGEYVVIQYETQFENKKSAVETVTPMLDKDGKWRVSGYYIK